MPLQPTDAEMPTEGLAPLPKATALLNSTVAGRTDHLQTRVPPGAYVVPADVVSGIGEGNTMAGAKLLHQVFEDPDIEPEGQQQIVRAKGGGISIKPSHRGLLHENLGVPQGQKIPGDKLRAAKTSASPTIRKQATFAENAKTWGRARGGAAEEDVPILGAGGECIIMPHAIVRKFGNLKRGHAELDKFVVSERKKIAAEMLKLPGPVKDDA